MNTGDRLKVGLFGIGLDAYWSQFPGLRERLTGFTEQIARKLENLDAQVIELGLIDTPEKSFSAGHQFRKADVDLIFLHVTTYALSSTVLPAVRRAKVPVVILNLAPAPAVRLLQLQSTWGSNEDDRRMAGALPGLSRTGDRKRTSTLPHSIFPGNGHARR